MAATRHPPLEGGPISADGVVMPSLGGGNVVMQSVSRSSERAHVSVFRLPKPLLQRVRWTFLQFSLISGCLLMGAVLTRDGSSAVVKAMGTVALAGLCWLWVEEYRHHLSSRWDVL